MIVKLGDREALIARAKYLMNKYSFNVIEAIKEAENQILRECEDDMRCEDGK